MTWSVPSTSLAAGARQAAAKAESFSSGLVSAVSRRNRVGGNRSTAPRTMPWVSRVSISPSTCTLSSSNGPSAVKAWVMLPKASSCWSSRQSVETSMRQRATYWPSWLRGVSRSIWITLAAGCS